MFEDIAVIALSAIFDGTPTLTQRDAGNAGMHGVLAGLQTQAVAAASMW